MQQWLPSAALAALIICSSPVLPPRALAAALVDPGLNPTPDEVKEAAGEQIAMEEYALTQKENARKAQLLGK
jgi:hypothetical protein